MISTIGRQVCCSWSSQVPQSVGQPCSTSAGELQRLGAGAREAVGPDVVARILGDQRLRRSAGRAGLLEVDATRADHDVGREQRETGRTGRRRLLEQMVARRIRRDVAAREERGHPGRAVGRDRALRSDRSAVQCLSMTTAPSRRTTRPSSAAPQPPQVVNSWAKNVWGLSRRPDGGTQVVHSMAAPPNDDDVDDRRHIPWTR